MKNVLSNFRDFPWRILITAILICAGGSLHIGLQISYYNTSQSVLKKFINETYLAHYGQEMSNTVYRIIWSLLLNIQFFGAIVGTLPLVRLSEKLGRHKTFYISSAFTIAGLILQSLSKVCSSFELLIFGGLLSSIGAGLSMSLEGMYLNEISPKRYRGFFTSCAGVLIQLGTAVGGVLGLPVFFGTKNLWPLMFAIEIAPTLILLLALPFLHESPKWLLLHEKEDACKEALKFYRSKDIDEEFNHISKETDRQKKNVKWKEIWEKKYLRRALWMSILVVLTVPFCGIRAIKSFSTDLLKNLGLTETNAQYATLGIICACFLESIIGSVLTERIGRRLLLLITMLLLCAFNLTLMAASLIFEANEAPWAGYLGIIACIGITVFASLGPLILQFTTSEMVPQSVRSSIQLLIMIIRNVAYLIVGFAFYPLEGAIGPYSFLIFAIPMAMMFVLFLKQFPETKNKSTGEIMRKFGYGKDGEADEEIDDDKK